MSVFLNLQMGQEIEQIASILKKPKQTGTENNVSDITSIRIRIVI